MYRYSRLSRVCYKLLLLVLLSAVKYMMYGFGDTDNPLPDTTDLVEDMTIDYLTNFVSRRTPRLPSV